MTTVLACCFSCIAVLGSSAGEPVAVAILDFQNAAKSSEHEGLEVALREWLITDLSSVREMRLVERARIADLLREMDLAESHFIDPSTAAKMGKGVGADAVLVGSFFVRDDQMRLDARLVDVETGQVIQAEKIEGSSTEFFKLEKELASKIVGSFGIKLSAFEKTRMERVHTKNLDAALAFGMAQRYSEAGELETAKKYADIAVTEDSRFALAEDLSRRVSALLAEVEGVDFRKKVEQAAALLWVLDNAPVHRHWRQRYSTGSSLSDWWPHTAYSDEEYDRILKQQGVAAGLGYRLERVVCLSLSPEFALRKPPTWTLDHSSNPWEAGRHPNGQEDLRESVMARNWARGLLRPYQYAFETVVNYPGRPGTADVLRELGMDDEYLGILDAFAWSDIVDAAKHEERIAEYRAAKAKMETGEMGRDPYGLARQDMGSAPQELRLFEQFRGTLLWSRFYVLFDGMRLAKAEKVMQEYRRQFPHDTETVLAMAHDLKALDDSDAMAKMVTRAEKRRLLAAKARPRVAAAKKDIEDRYERALKNEQEVLTQRQKEARDRVRERPNRELWKKWFEDLSDDDFDALMVKESAFDEHYWGDNSPRTRFYHVPGCRHLRLVITPANAGAVYPFVYHSTKAAEADGLKPCPYCLGGKEKLD